MLTITKAPLTLTANPIGRAYGAANPTFSGVLSGFVNGESLATSGVSGSATFSTSATLTSAVGTYAITPALGTLASANYAVTTFTDGVLTIGQTPLTITADSKTKVYGATTPALTATITGFVNGESLATSGITGAAAVTTAATTSTSVGSATLTATVGSLVSANYAFTTFTDGALTITKAPLTITADPQTKTYGAANPALTATISGFVNGESLATSGITGAAAVTTTATAATGVGTPAITVAVGSLVSANYAFTTFTDGVLTITKAPLTVTADAKTKIYGAANPTLTATISGFVNGETLATSGITGAAAVTTTATAATGVGTPAITVAVGSLVSANYAFTTFTDGVLTITKAPLTVTADNQNRAYGAAEPTFTATLTGFVNGESLATSGVGGTAAVTTTATTTSAAGTYPLTPALGSLTATNYAFTTFTAGTLTIGQASQTITFGTLAAKTYGDASFTVAATASSGLTPSYSIVSGPATLSGSTVTLTGAGTVVVRATQAGDGNYTAATPVDQSFTVAKATLTVTADERDLGLQGILDPDRVARRTALVPHAARSLEVEDLFEK